MINDTRFDRNKATNRSVRKKNCAKLCVRQDVFTSRISPCDDYMTTTTTTRNCMDETTNSPMMRPSSFEFLTDCTQNKRILYLKNNNHLKTSDITSDQSLQYFKCKKKQIQMMGASEKTTTKIFLTLALLLLLFLLEFTFDIGNTPIIRNTNTVKYSATPTTILNNIQKSIMVEAATTNNLFDHQYHHHDKFSHNNVLGRIDGEKRNYNIHSRDMSNLPQQPPYITTENEYALGSNNIDSYVRNSDDTSPVVVDLGVSSYVSASPISSEKHNHRHQHAHHHHLRPLSEKLSSSSASEVITSSNKNKNDEIINSTHEERTDHLTGQQPFKLQHDNDKKELFSRHNLFAPQQYKRSYVHDKIDDENTKTQVGDNLKRDNLPAEMFITSPFGAKLNSLRSKFSMNPATIIQTRESLAMGATFLNHTYVKDFNSCLHDCWHTSVCDTSIYQETPAPTSATSSGQQQHENSKNNDYICYLFSCIKDGKLVCKFTAHNYYVSSFLKHHRVTSSEDHHTPVGSSYQPVGSYKAEKMFEHNSFSPSAQETELHQLRGYNDDINNGHKNYDTNSVLNPDLDDSRKGHSHDKERHGERPRKIVSHKLESNDIFQITESTRDNVGNNRDYSQNECHRYQFKCHSNKECIAIYNICDGISQCPDGSDERSCPATTTEPTLTVDEGEVQVKKFANEGLAINKNLDYSILPSKDQLFEDVFRPEVNYLPGIMKELKPTRTSSQNSLYNVGLGNPMYPSNEPSLGIEGIFDKDSGRFITYHDASNPFYSVDSNAILPQKNVLFPSQDSRNTFENDPKLTPEKSNSIPRTDALSSFHYKPSSSVDFLQDQRKTFPVPNSFNKLDESDKTMNGLGGWQHLIPKEHHKFNMDNQKSSYRTPAPSVPNLKLSNFDKIPTYTDDVDEDQREHSNQHVQSKTSPDHEQKDLKNEESNWNAHKLVLINPAGAPDKINGTLVAHQDKQPVLYNHLKNGRSHSDKQHYWHDTHIASITIGQEENDDFSARGTHSALIAFMFGIAITGMLIVIVGLKMKSIRKKLVRRGRRRSLVHEADFLINGMHL